MKKKSLVFFIILFFAIWNIAAMPTWHTNIDTALWQAKKTDKLLLISFSGSDWCKPCIKLSKEVLETEEFITFAEKHLVLLKADFPKYKQNQLSKEQTQHNEKLAEKYNTDGAFPLLVLLDKEMKLLWKGGYSEGGPAQYIPKFEKYVPTSTEAVKKTYKKSEYHMGSMFEIAAVSNNERLAEQGVAKAYKEIERIEKLISEWDSLSETSMINRNAGIKPVKVSDELFYLIKRSIKVSELSQGGFDISWAAMDKIWKFDGSEQKMPSPEKVAASVKNVGYKKILIDDTNKTIFLSQKGMKIGFGGIGQGYGANKAMQLMKKMGIKDGLVNASGDIVAWGKKENGESWKVGIADPKEKGKIISWLKADDMAIVTSGNYERYALIDGQRYGHIIDPRSGYPVMNVKSVTIICPDVEVADALAKGVYVLGEKDGIALINSLKDIECVLVNDKDEIITSDGLQLNYYQENNSPN